MMTTTIVVVVILIVIIIVIVIIIIKILFGLVHSPLGAGYNATGPRSLFFSFLQGQYSP